MKTLLEGQRIVVTGSSRGLGRAFARALAAAGASLVVNGTDHRTLQAVVEEIRGKGGDVVGVTGSVGDDEVCRRLMQASVDAFGGLDTVIANAGIARDRTLLKATPDEFDATILTNLRGVWSTCRHAALAMQDHGGHIILVTSGAAMVPTFGQSAYAASKAGGLGLMYGLIDELARHSVRINALGPSAQTDMTRDRFDIASRRASAAGQSALPPDALGYGDPLGVAPVVVALASDLASTLNGQIIRFNGNRLTVWSHPSEAISQRRDNWDPASIAAFLVPNEQTMTRL